MKKMNRKGFTLIELLAVIVVLAIILVITVPMILTSLSDTRTSALQASANSTAKFYEEQLGLKTVGKGNDSFATDATFSSGKLSAISARQITKTEAEILGLNTTDYAVSTSDTITAATNCDTTANTTVSCVKWDANGSVTVVLVGGNGDNSKFKEGSTQLRAQSNN